MDRTTTVSGPRLVETYKIPALPPPVDFETLPILKALKEAHKNVAELKGRAGSLPNQGILIDTLTLQEAAASSEIENIVTTQDELYQMNTRLGLYPSPEAKEVALYGSALRLGFEQLHEKKGNISNSTIIALFQTLKRSTGDFRRTPGTALKNDRTGEIVYVPPQSFNDISRQMGELESFINEPLPENIDPLVAMAIVHHQFESIHPFPDGNGRIGRILNVLFLCKLGLLEIPILYLSRYITRNKGDYYRLLQATRDTGDWEPWTLYMLAAVSETAAETTRLVQGIRILMAETKKRLRDQHSKIYSQELINNLFRHPYTRIEYVVDEVGVSRQTAGKYLNELADSGLLKKMKIGLNNYYINGPLVDLLAKP
ncbi:Fic family protein [Roseovarius sp. 10]|uniref:Fic family protein n=1 Tax=Roseovarius sp. 10 TaxID=3080563 RepID=UPI0029554E71|nr:Fic family protein [Roseovarius sp. 10]MDV7201665.1 Fic family protein [Roseovarius sp. 10]